MDDELSILHSSHNPRCDAHIDKYFEGYCSFQYIVDSRVRLSYDDDAHELTGDWFFACWPGPRIRFEAMDRPPRWDHRHVAFRGPRVVSWQAAGLIPMAPQQASGDYRARFDALLRASQRRDVWGLRLAMNALEGLLLELAERRDRSLSPPWLAKVTQALEQDPTTPPDYDRLAASVGMGLSTLRRRFRDATGYTLHDYFLTCRTAAARELLLHSDLPIQRIADQLGYQNVHFFTRQFAQRTGTPPAEFRRTRL